MFSVPRVELSDLCLSLLFYAVITIRVPPKCTGIFMCPDNILVNITAVLTQVQNLCQESYLTAIIIKNWLYAVVLFYTADFSLITT